MADEIDQVKDASAAGRARARALIVPREHGAWGLLLVPLFTGLAAGLGPAQRLWPLGLFVAAALSLFWLRTPVESLLGSGPMTARTSHERWIAVIASAMLAAAAGVSLIMLMWGGRNLQLLLIGLIAASAFAVQTGLRALGRKARMPSQLAGAIGLTATAPAAYYLGTGQLDSRALVLWLANWLFAWNQIHFVQLRIHAARAGTFAEKFARGKFFFVTQIALGVALALATAGRVAPLLVIVAFLPALFRGTRWFFRQAEPLDVKKLGWSEMKQGAAFGILLALAFIFR
jgi:YwiC-like protein